MYYSGKTIEDKDLADQIMYDNMIRKINDHSKWWIIKFLRKRRAKKYYLAIKYLGEDAFWAGKK